jgi:hypothetical protein
MEESRKEGNYTAQIAPTQPPKKSPVAPAGLVTAKDRAQPEWPVSPRIVRSLGQIRVNDTGLAHYPNHGLDH